MRKFVQTDGRIIIPDFPEPEVEKREPYWIREKFASKDHEEAIIAKRRRRDIREWADARAKRGFTDDEIRRDVRYFVQNSQS